MVKKRILKGEFDKAFDLIIENSLDFETVKGILLEIAFETESLLVLTFTNYLLQKCGDARIHLLIAELLVTAFSHFEGAYPSAFYHIKQADLNMKGDVSVKEFLLLFHEIPDKLISEEEAKKIAIDVLKEKPDSIPALRILGE
ncbi:hypothetical protein JQC72_06690 [Polycladomyces sp. WAk]|uniref:EF-hand domain-containing protein n=1 Tax=Polycladomyces zharkentensis TaxID=2807616 RepID=A0ABS2WIH5_9BACL|nr:hypothetical protein [Polycladomyces sp. WAk]MBN2909209.1 hypothetical protein [Polycladomyces sp. WAk]